MWVCLYAHVRCRSDVICAVIQKAVASSIHIRSTDMFWCSKSRCYVYAMYIQSRRRCICVYWYFSVSCEWATEKFIALSLCVLYVPCTNYSTRDSISLGKHMRAYFSSNFLTRMKLHHEIRFFFSSIRWAVVVFVFSFGILHYSCVVFGFALAILHNILNVFVCSCLFFFSVSFFYIHSLSCRSFYICIMMTFLFVFRIIDAFLSFFFCSYFPFYGIHFACENWKPSLRQQASDRKGV